MAEIIVVNVVASASIGKELKLKQQAEYTTFSAPTIHKLFWLHSGNMVAQPGFEPEYRRPERRRMPNYPTGPHPSLFFSQSI